MKYLVVDCGYVTPCHRFVGAHNQKGYGLVTIRKPGEPRTSRGAHVVAWEREHGPCPKGMEIDHLCEVRDCIRVDHLEAVTHTENVRRSRATKLTEADVAYIRSTDKGATGVARELGISRQQVWAIRTGRSRARQPV